MDSADPPPQEPCAETATADFLAQAEAAARLLEEVVADRSLLARVPEALRKRLLAAAGRASRPSEAERSRLKKARRREARRARRERDEALLDTTGIRCLRANPIFRTPRRQRPPLGPSEAIGHTSEERGCYCCQRRHREVHFFYDQMCLPCGDFNYAKRFPSADLSGRVALVTGARVKIGYQAAILLLRNGCRVVCTTRFPRDAARRYAREEDFSEWADRLEIHGVDLRFTPAVEALCARLLRRCERLDFVINNACQTVRRPPGFYEHLLAGEREALDADAARLLAPSTPRALARTADAPLDPAALSQLRLTDEDLPRAASLFPAGVLDADLQQVDLRRVNSWRLRAHEVSAVELIEVHLVNAIAPFVINARLKPLLLRVPTRDKHIVNVSAMEGQFYRTFKSDKHPHTNMAKAALNMLTRTASLDYVRDGIHVNSVDTGWVTDEDPVHHAERKRREHRFHPPLDIVDGAARIVDPIFDGLNTGRHVWGQFLKDYKPADW